MGATVTPLATILIRIGIRRRFPIGRTLIMPGGAMMADRLAVER